MTNYHPDVQRAYDAHCADGYVFPDDETGPQEATGATESDETRDQAHGDGAGLREAVETERSTPAARAGGDVIERAARVLCEEHRQVAARCLCGFEPRLDAFRFETHRARALADAGLLADPEHEHVHRLVEGVREGDGWTVQLGGALIAKCDTYGKTAMHGDLDRARGALGETLDDLTRTLARAEKAEARAAELEAAWSEACEVAGKAADECAAKIARLREEAAMSYEDGYNQGHEDAHADGAAQDRLCRARDTAAALEAENASLTAKVERVRQARDGWDSGYLPIHWRGFAADIDAALSDTTGGAS